MRKYIDIISEASYESPSAKIEQLSREIEARLALKANPGLQKRFEAAQKLPTLPEMVRELSDILADASNLTESRRGLAPIGELRARVFWNPRHADLIAMLNKSTIGDLRGSYVETKTERLTAIWPARTLGHWNFHNECLQREGINAKSKIDLRICRDLSILSEEKYWSKGDHYAGDGFFCALYPDTDPSSIPELSALFGPVKIIDKDA